MLVITVLKPFTEGRSRRAYMPGEVVTDPLWHDPESRRAEAHAARGLVKVEHKLPAPVVGEDLAALAPKGDE